MKPSISIITIGVDDLERAFNFYRELFDIADEQIEIPLTSQRRFGIEVERQRGALEQGDLEAHCVGLPQ